MVETSVLIPTRGRLPLLKKCLANVACQTYQNFEVLIAIDGADFEVESWIKAHYPNYNLVINEKPMGAASARNKLLEKAKGDFFAFLDDDDFWAHDYLEQQISYLKRHPNRIFSYAKHYIGNDSVGWRIADDKSILENSPVIIIMLAECFIHTMSVVVCRRKVLEVGLLDTKYKIVHDFEWYIRILSSKGNMSGYIAKPLVYRTIHANQLISKYKEWQREEQIVADAFFRKHPAFRKKEKTVRAFRSLYFAYIAFKLKNYNYGLQQLYAAFIMHSFKSTSYLIAKRIYRNTFIFFETH